MKKYLFLAVLFCLHFFSFGQYTSPNLYQIIRSLEHPVIQDGSYSFSKTYTDKHSGVSHGYGSQTINNIPLEGAYFSIHSKGSKVLSFHQSFESLDLLNAPKAHALDKTQILKILLDRNDIAEGIELNNLEWQTLDSMESQWINEAISPEAIRIKKTYIMSYEGLVPSWSISFLLPDESHWYYTIVNAISGEVLDEIDWMQHCSLDHDHAEHSFDVQTLPTETETTAHKKGDGATYLAYPLGIESPNHGDRELLNEPADNTASPYGWHDDDGVEGHEYTITRGNNVWARDDKDANNTDGFSPDGEESLSFDFEFEAGNSNEENLGAAVTNLFVWNNFMHDVTYQYGFDEESGNFQENNYGNATSGASDHVYADAQDGSGTNNANFATPTDGQNPRMQMYLWGATGSIGMEVLSPSTYRGTYTISRAGFGPQLTKDVIKGELVLVEDGTTSPNLGCEELTQDLTGKIALIERGTCSFVDKVRNAQNAGAIAVIIFTDNRPVLVMGGDGTQGDIEIPAVMIERTLGLNLAQEVGSTQFSVELYDKSGTGGRDADFDNGVIAHEYGHGISTRLTGGALNSNCLRNEEQMGEGWSDFFALAFTHQEGDEAGDRRGIGTYLQRQPITGGGIRPYPYSADITRSPYNYEQIAVLSVPHGVGSVWCAMLWDLYWAFIDEYGFDPDLYNGTGGNNMVIQLVIDGMKLQPCNPGFTDARDAILLADEVLNDGKHDRLIWESFTKRGLGYDADGGSSFDRGDGKNGYELPPKYRSFVQIEKMAISQIGEKDVLRYSINYENTSEIDFEGVVIIDTVPENLIIDQSSFDCNWEVNGQILTLTIDLLEAGQSGSCHFDTRIKDGNYGFQYARFGGETHDENRQTIESPTNSSNLWEVQFQRSSVGRGAFFVEGIRSVSEQIMTFDIGKIGEDVTLEFEHFYNTESAKDGGLIEYSLDGGGEWIDARRIFLKGGYSSFINSSESPLKNRYVFSGTNDDFEKVILDLSGFANESFSVRFRFATDDANASEGWYVDDINVGKKSSVTNRAYSQFDGNEAVSRVKTDIIDSESIGITKSKTDVIPWQLYPNPASQFTQVEIPEGYKNATLEIYQMDGRLLRSQNVSSGIHKIEISELATGSYIFSIRHAEGVENRSFTKQ